MGVKYSATDSAQLIQAMTSNLQVANQVTDRLSSGCDHLIASLESGELQGAAYTAGKGLFTEIIIPAIKKLQAAIDDIQEELNSYKYADSTVSEYGILDLDLLKEQLETKQEMLEKTQAQLAEHQFLFRRIIDGLAGVLADNLSKTNALTVLENQLNIGIREIQEKIDKLEWFVADVSKYFTDSLEILILAIQGAVSLSQITIDAEGNYYTNGADMSWISNMKKEEIRTYGRGEDPRKSLINQNIRDLMLSDEAADYYRSRLTAFLEGKPSSDWPLLIQEFNKTLSFDQDGNILLPVPVKINQGGIDIWVNMIFKNGKLDEEYTQQAIKEQAGQFFESLGENAAEFLVGLLNVVGGALLDVASLGLGAGGLAVALPTGGTVTIPATAAAVSGLAAGTTMVVGGSAVMGDALSQMAAANAAFQVSFAQNYDSWQANKPTSKTISGKGGKQIEGRAGNRKVKIRVDLEPNSGAGGQGKLQVQSGSGKSGYDINRHLNVNEITGKDYIRNWVNKTADLKNQTKSVKEEIIERLWKGYQEMVN
ncbi:T7SS effector LXG polymorphic toxin [Streptococcus cristatus]|uniref:LXG domain-containing protein n=1 Tax=Streptococcus cristatus TaxID=45634 RepID=A0A139N1U5_STRCR|nr:T7SS effector LXG polymorphic toxin [Streptococcus cristatus]KXT69787.1 hypothetical protein SCRDD08_01061 [Streptococcus cristatus]